jgi:hypothetical protein
MNPDHAETVVNTGRLAITPDATGTALGGNRRPVSDAGVNGSFLNSEAISTSTASAIEPRGALSYLGGRSEAKAALTVFRATSRRRAIVLIPEPSERCHRRISPH